MLVKFQIVAFSEDILQRFSCLVAVSVGETSVPAVVATPERI